MSELDTWEQALAATAPTVDQMGSISGLVRRAYETQEHVSFLESSLEKAKAELNEILTRALPDEMAIAKTNSFTTDEGLKVTIKDFCRGSLPKDPERRKSALIWLEQNGAQDIIRNELVAEFRKGQDNVVGEVERQLEEMGVLYSRERNVHHSTLTAFARERMRNNEELPLETLGLFTGREAKIDRK